MPDGLIENRTFDEIRIGDAAGLVRTLTPQDIDIFAIMSGDVNPAHVDDAFAKSDMFHKVVAHGMWSASLFSTVFGTQLPGPGAVYVDQSLHFRRPVGLGDTLTITVRAVKKIFESKRVIFDCLAVNQEGKQVVTGTAELIAPTEKVSRPRVRLPEIELRTPGRHCRALIESALRFDPLWTAVVHPVDTGSLLGAVEAARSGLIIPIFIGPEDKIREAARRAQLDLSPFKIFPTPHSDAAAETAVAMAARGEVEALMKGALYTRELMNAVIDDDFTLRTERRMSHVFFMDVPAYSRPLYITDAVINIAPALPDKRDIAQNAIELAHAAGIETPRVAALAAVEAVTEKFQSTIDAASLSKMAEKGQIVGGFLDGPLGFDTAISEEAAKAKGAKSPVAGRADIFVVPDIEAGNMLAKQLQHVKGAEAGSIVLGARAPIILTSPSDRALSRLASCALALLQARNSPHLKPLKVSGLL